MQQLVLERDPARIQQILAYIREKSAERLELLKQYDLTITTAKARELADATKEALAPYMLVRGEVIRLGTDPTTKAEAATMLHEKLEPTYSKLQEAIDAEVTFNKANAANAAERIQASVSMARTGMIVGLLIGFILASVAGYLVVQAVDRPLTRLIDAVGVMQLGDYSRKIPAQDGEFGILAAGFNLMTESLQEMIRRVQKSGLQVNTSATEIAATAQEQLSTASEVAATTSEIGATSKQISATSRELAETIKDISEVAEKTAALAGSG